MVHKSSWFSLCVKINSTSEITAIYVETATIYYHFLKHGETSTQNTELLRRWNVSIPSVSGYLKPPVKWSKRCGSTGSTSFNTDWIFILAVLYPDMRNPKLFLDLWIVVTCGFFLNRSFSEISQPPFDAGI